jgi:hypothetical protein
MAHCNPLGEATTRAVEVENIDRVVVMTDIEWTISENPAASDGEERLLSPGTADDSLGEGGSNDENSRTYYFGSSTITIGKIKEMVEKGYFLEGEPRAPRAETVLEPDNDEAIVYKDFFVASLRIPSHPSLADILLKFQAQLHQLTPNSIAQLSKYF